MALIEILLALLISRSLTFAKFAFLAALVGIFNIRCKHSESMNLLLGFFVFYYLMLNFMVNTVDFLWNFAFKGVYFHFDQDFVASFSYKTH